jgi:hypothetical protein
MYPRSKFIHPISFCSRIASNKMSCIWVGKRGSVLLCMEGFAKLLEDCWVMYPLDNAVCHCQSKVIILFVNRTTGGQFHKDFCPFWVSLTEYHVLLCFHLLITAWTHRDVHILRMAAHFLFPLANRLQIMHKFKPYVPARGFRRCAVRFNKFEINNEIPCGLIPAMLQFDICFQVRTWPRGTQIEEAKELMPGE